MADNVTLDPGTGGAVMKTDDDGTAHWAYAKIAFGADNTQTRVTSTVGMPVKVLSGALELGKVEDTAHSTGDVGVMMLAVRNDTLTALAGADGDYSALQVNGDGALYVRSAGHASTDNSSATPLGISGVFTGTAEDITHYSSVSVSVFADEASASGGLSLQFSTDGTNWDNTEGHDVAAGVHHFVGGMGESKWFRVVYTNGTTAQTAFRLQTMLRNAPLSGEIEPIDHDIEGGEDAQLVRAVITAQKPDTTYANIQATAGGNLKTSIEEVDTSASGLGKIEDSAHSSGDVGVMSLAVRNDTAGTLAGADGDYSPFQVDAEGNLRVVDMAGGSTVDSGNSSTSTLTAAAAFTGAGKDVKGYSAIGVAVYASHDSGVDGISLEFSTDNSNWDHKSLFNLDFSARPNRFFQLPITARYFRVVYTNGGTNQTAFRLQTILHTDNMLTTIHRVGDDFSADRSAQVVKSVLCAQKAGSGDFTPVDSTAGGNLKVAIEEFDASLPTGTNLIGDVGISGARTSGGTTLYKNIDVDQTEDQVKGTAGQIYWIHAINLSNAVKFLKIYNATAASVTVGTTVPDLTFPIPTQGDTNGAGFVLTIVGGIAFGTAITIAATTGVLDNDSGAPGANEVIVNLGYA